MVIHVEGLEDDRKVHKIAVIDYDDKNISNISTNDNE